jgi:hypothetical protein
VRPESGIIVNINFLLGAKNIIEEVDSIPIEIEDETAAGAGVVVGGNPAKMIIEIKEPYDTTFRNLATIELVPPNSVATRKLTNKSNKTTSIPLDSFQSLGFLQIVANFPYFCNSHCSSLVYCSLELAGGETKAESSCET